MKTEDLIKEALKARERSYAPYSGFAVGAALLGSDNRVYFGCNIENASYSATNCAERTAFYQAIAAGERTFKAIAIVGGPKDKAPVEFCYPCGICRQVMAEFCKMNEFRIIVAKSATEYEEFWLEDLLPHGFIL